MSAPYHAPMSPIELFEEARLTEAIAAQSEIVRAQPHEIPERFLLCDFLAFAGQRDGVREHLDQIDPIPAIAAYLAEWRALLSADDLRHSGKAPALLMDPPANFSRRVQASAAAASGRIEEAIALLDDADEAADCLTGHVDGREFEGWRDTDDLLGSVLEVFTDGRYFWLPVEQVQKLRLEDANELRDTLYRPANILLVDGRRLEVFLPALYVGTSTHEEDGIRVGAGIDWVERDGLMRGIGARTMLFGEEELNLNEFRQVEVRRN